MGLRPLAAFLALLVIGRVETARAEPQQMVAAALRLLA